MCVWGGGRTREDGDRALTLSSLARSFCLRTEKCMVQLCDKIPATRFEGMKIVFVSPSLRFGLIVMCNASHLLNRCMHKQNGLYIHLQLWSMNEFPLMINKQAAVFLFLAQYRCTQLKASANTLGRKKKNEKSFLS